jgi:tetratricopeptide (TPR) repeat protein
MKGLKKVLRKISLVLILAVFLLYYSGLAEALPGSLAVDYLLELGKNAYQQGNYPEALHEFKKVLLLQPEQKEAIYYIRLIKKIEEVPVVEIPIVPKVKKKIPEAILEEEKYIEVIPKVEVIPVIPKPEAIPEKIKIIPEVKPIPEKEITPPLAPPEIEKPPVILPPPAVERKGEIGLFIDGEEVSIEKPILIREERPLLSLREVASKLYFSLLDMGEGNFKLISPEGMTREIKVSFLDGEPMVNEKELKDYFSVDIYFDEPQKAFHIRTKLPSQFQAYALEKPAEEIKKEKELEEMAKKATLVPEKPTYIPEAARPSVELRGNLSYTYIDYHVSPTYHSLVSSLTGRVYDFDLRYQSNWKDINGVFDHDYTYLNLTKPSLFIGLFDQAIDLYPLRVQSQQFTGLKLIKEWGKLNKTTFVGGDIENTVSGTSGSVKYLGSIYGVKEEFAPLEWLGLKGALLYLENEPDILSLSGTSSFPRNNTISFAEASLKLPYDLTLSTQLAYCDYEPDNEPDTSVEDWDWRIGSKINKKRYNLGFAYEFVGDKYASLGNPASYQDYEGWNLYGNYKVMDNWSLSSSLMRYTNNVEDNPDKVTQENQTFNLSSQHRLTDRQSVNLSFSRFITDPSGENAGPSSKSNLYRIDYFLPFLLDTRLILDYQHYRMDSSDASEYYSHTTGSSLFKSFGRGSSWYLSQRFIKTLYKSAADNLNSSTSFNLNYIFNPDLSLYFNSSYTRDKTEETIASDTLSGSTGLKYQIFPDTTLNLEYNISSYNLKTEKDRWPRNWSIMAYISQNFSFSTPPNFGVIDGWVFKDINTNGKLDYGEPGTEEVRLYLEDKRETVTSSSGYFRFPYVVPGRQKIYLDLASLSTEWTVEEPEREVEVRPRRENKVSFLLLKASSIKGKIFIDENQDTVFQDTEEPLENIAVILLPGEQLRWTNLEGDFKFDYLLPGKYKLRMNLESIPLGYELVSKGEIELELSAGEEIKDINFIVQLIPIPVEKF